MLTILGNRKAAFLHIPKNAGIAITTQLRALLPGTESVVSRHATIDKLFAKSGLTAADLFVFGVIRNPFDRFVSAYHFFQNGKLWVGRDKRARTHMMQRYPTFDAFARAMPRSADVMITRFDARHFTPQKHWLFHEGRYVLDFTLRMDQLAQDWAVLCSILSIKSPVLGSRNISGHKDYQQYYTEQTRKLVSDYYRDDLDLLPYTFAGYTPRSDDVEQ